MSIEKLLQQPESKTLEFKRDLSSPQPILKTIVGFVNTAGGILIIGKDPNGTICGVEDVLNAEEKIANLITDHISPKVVPEIEIITVDKKDLLVIRVSRWRGPFYLNREGLEKGVYIRLGSTTRRAEGKILDELNRDLQNIIYDQQPLPNVEETDLNSSYIKRCFNKVGKKITNSKMRTLKVLVDYQNREVASRGGVILFGKDDVREKYFPNVRISCARFQGKTKTQFIDRQELRGSVLEALKEVPKFIQKNTRLAGIIRGMKRVDISEYPETAIREVLINALVHCDYAMFERHIQVAIYSDRLEFISPGSFPLGYTLEDFKSGVSHIRNHTIVRIFKELGEMEEWGSGYKRIVETCQEGGYPIPLWEEIGNELRVTFSPHFSTVIEDKNRDSQTLQQLPLEQRILLLFEKKQIWKIREMLQELDGNIKERALRYELKKLREKGLIDKEGSGPATRWKLLDSF